MSSGSAMSSGSSQHHLDPTVAEVVALIYCLRIMLVIWGVLPLSLLIIPAVVWIWMSSVNLLTQGEGFLTSIIAAWMTVVGRGLIWKYAPSEAKRDEALQQVQIILPLGSFVVVRIISRYVVAPILRAFGLPSDMLQLSPYVPWAVVVRLASIMLILGTAVVVRYVGPISVVRCSSFPLISHPYTARWRTFISKVTSLDSIITWFISAGDKPGELWTNPFRQPIIDDGGFGRRYQIPPLQNSAYQMLWSAGVAVLLAFVVAPLLPSYVTLSALSACLAVTLWAHLGKHCLDPSTSAHEIDLKRYQDLSTQSFLTLKDVFAQLTIVTASFLFIPVLAVLASFFSDGALSVETWKVAGCWFLVATFSNIYMSTLDLTCRYCLSYPSMRVSRMVQEITGDLSPEATLDVLLCSILQNDARIIQNIRSQTRHPGSLLLEEEEVRRHDAAAEQMATILLKRMGVAEGLDQDILRASILESVGGLVTTKRHITSVQGWIKTPAMTSDVPWETGNHKEPLAVPLVRALCCYTGGLGTALQQVVKARSIENKKRYPDLAVTWWLPPGAVTCCAWAVTATARFIVESVSSAGNAMTDWRSSHLSMMVPVALHAAYSLRSGLLEFDQILGVPTDVDRTVRPELQLVYVACNQAALSILHTLRSVEGLRNVHLQVHTKCREWLEELMGVKKATSPAKESVAVASLTGPPALS